MHSNTNPQNDAAPTIYAATASHEYVIDSNAMNREICVNYFL